MAGIGNAASIPIRTSTRRASAVNATPNSAQIIQVGNDEPKMFLDGD